MQVRLGYEGDVQPEPKIKFKIGRHLRIMDGLGYIKASGEGSGKP